MDHLTPDVLAAWMDGTLTDGERSAAEAHAADCVRCQSVLAAMVRTMPARSTRAWWSTGTVRWLVPLATAAVVIATWVGVHRQGAVGTPQRANGALTTAEQRETAPPPVTPPSATVPESRREPQQQAKLKQETTTNSLARDLKDSAKVDALKSRNDRAEANVPVPPAEPKGPVAGPPQTLGGVAQVPAPSAADAPAAFGAQSGARTPPPPPAAPAQPPAVGGVAESVTVSNDAALRKSSPRAALREAGMRPVDVISPERSFRWRAVTPGSILYSMDGGLSWRSSPTRTSVVVHAGSSPARNVCWLVGQEGTVLLTTDGQTWTVRPFPERTDLTDVHATDAKTATVTTANQRRFATSDGGATWAPLQEN